MQNETKTLIPVNIMGKGYEVPLGLTIMKALEYAGYRLSRGCGCRGGVCGACATIYRKKGEYRLQVGLACQTVVEPDIYILQLPFFPANKALYEIDRAVPNERQIRRLYPEMLRCMGCNTCTNSCPMDLEVMNYISAAIGGDYHKVVELSIECVACGLCAARCPAELAPFNIALLVRRMVGKHLVCGSAQLADRLAEIKAGKYDKELKVLKHAARSWIEKRYQELQATKGASV